MMQSRPAKLACMLGAIFGAVVLVAVPREASTAAEPGRRLSREHASRAALCYAARYPDVKAAFCDGDRCNARQAMAHFRDHGRREGRLFGCDGEANGTAPALDRPNETLYQLQSSFHTQSTETEPTARARRAGEDSYYDVFDGNGAPSGPNCTLFSGADRLLAVSRGRSGSG